MAIQYKLTNTNTTDEKSTILTLVDESVGYGNNGNPAREDLAILIYGVYRSSKGDIKVDFTSYSPTISSPFKALITRDGWYKFSMLSIPVLTVDSTRSGVYFNTNTNEILSIVNNSPILNSPIILQDDFVSITPIDLVNLIQTEYNVASTEVFIVANSTKTMLSINSMISDLLTNNVDFTDKRLVRLKDNYNAVRCILQGSIYEYARGNKSVAQKNIEFLNTNDYTKI